MIRFGGLISLLWLNLNVLEAIAGVEQTLIIELDRNSREIGDNHFYSNSKRRSSGERHASRNYLLGDDRRDGSAGLRSAGQRTQYTQPPYAYLPSTIPQESLPNSIFELKSLLIQMDRTFSNRLNSLAGRVDRLEANQNSFRRSVMAEWQSLNNLDKRIRLFNNAKNTWREAQEICEANSGRLLHIDSADENQQISNLLHAAHPANDDPEGTAEDQTYWIGMQSTLAFNISTPSFTNFDIAQINDDLHYQNDSVVIRRRSATEEDTSAERLEEDKEQPNDRWTRQTYGAESDEFPPGCAVISPTRNGKWISRDCEERHQFICQL